MTDPRRVTDVSAAADSNLGLWLERYPPAHDQKSAGQFLAGALAVVRVPDGYAEAFARRRRGLEHFAVPLAPELEPQTRWFEAEVAGRIAVGLGAASVLETSLRLERVWGVPLIPGSALKGVTAKWAHGAGRAEWRAPAQPGGSAGPWHRLIFGDVAAAGCVVFHDAWWVPESTSGRPEALDVMTVHHPEYYGGGEAGPLDTDSPVPVSFLSARGRFAVAVSGPRRVLDVLEPMLREALEQGGVGAKTAAGYGRLRLGEGVRWPSPTSAPPPREGDPAAQRPDGPGLRVELGWAWFGKHKGKEKVCVRVGEVVERRRPASVDVSAVQVGLTAATEQAPLRVRVTFGAANNLPEKLEPALEGPA